MPVLAVLAFLIVPIVEIYVIIQVGHVIGAWPTVALLIIESALGAWLVKREGRRAWRALREALHTARMPGRELGDAALILVGGTLLLTPGFVTDVVGFFFVLPPTRSIARRLLTGIVTRRLLGRMAGPTAGNLGAAFTTFARPGSGGSGGSGGPTGSGGSRGSGGPGRPGRTTPHRPDVVQGEVIEGTVIDPDDPTNR